MFKHGSSGFNPALIGFNLVPASVQMECCIFLLNQEYTVTKFRVQKCSVALYRAKIDASLILYPERRIAQTLPITVLGPCIATYAEFSLFSGQEVLGESEEIQNQ